VASALEMFAGSAHRAPPPFRLTVTTTIPRQAGLAGSSAIILSTLKALFRRNERQVDPLDLAQLAWRAETEVLHVTAGPQDRVVQAIGGLVDMDFSVDHGFCRPVTLDSACLPPLFVAWDQKTGTPSGRIHRPLRDRFDEGEPEVVAVMEELRELVGEGIDALQRSDHVQFRQCMNRNFDLRATILSISDQDARMVALGREHGAAVKFCGSGGSVLVAPPGDWESEQLASVYANAGFGWLRLRVSEEKLA
jgi:glucuronokinase